MFASNFSGESLVVIYDKILEGFGKIDAGRVYASDRINC